MTDPTKPSDATREAGRTDAKREHVPDQMPSSEEEAKADTLELDPEVVEHEQEMAERGKNQQGEGRVP